MSYQNILSEETKKIKTPLYMETMIKLCLIK